MNFQQKLQDELKAWTLAGGCLAGWVGAEAGRDGGHRRSFLSGGLALAPAGGLFFRVNPRSASRGWQVDKQMKAILTVDQLHHLVNRE